MGSAALTHPALTESEKPAWVLHRTANLDRLEYVAATARGVVIVAKRGGRVYSINVPGSEVLDLVGRLRFPLRKATRQAKK
jgi:hypothetical protein